MTEVINSISDFEKYIKKTKKVVEEALDFFLGPRESRNIIYIFSHFIFFSKKFFILEFRAKGH